MIGRSEYEKLEKERLSPRASLSEKSRGRQRFEEECQLRTAYQRDRDRIIHSKAFRRLKHKTQVFIAPEHDHFRTRLTHTLEVAQIARTIARGLALNEDLVEAISLGHDLGHTPFGHAGEAALNELVAGGFEHNKQSLRVVDVLESGRDGRGLNLTWEVRDGILKHTGDEIPSTLEGQIVGIADRFAYINHDIDDALRGGIIKQDMFPHQAIKLLGKTHGERIRTMVLDLIENSWGKEKISQSGQVELATRAMRDFLFEKVYIGSEAKKEEEKVQYFLQVLFNYYLANPGQMPRAYEDLQEEWGLDRAVADYIAGMSDRFALTQGQHLFFPRPWFSS